MDALGALIFVLLFTGFLAFARGLAWAAGRLREVPMQAILANVVNWITPHRAAAGLALMALGEYLCGQKTAALATLGLLVKQVSGITITLPASK